MVASSQLESCGLGVRVLWVSVSMETTAPRAGARRQTPFGADRDRPSALGASTLLTSAVIPPRSSIGWPLRAVRGGCGTEAGGSVEPDKPSADAAGTGTSLEAAVHPPKRTLLLGDGGVDGEAAV